MLTTLKGKGDVTCARSGRACSCLGAVAGISRKNATSDLYIYVYINEGTLFYHPEE